jgi:hypothetical protein
MCDVEEEKSLKTTTDLRRTSLPRTPRKEGVSGWQPASSGATVLGSSRCWVKILPIDLWRAFKTPHGFVEGLTADSDVVSASGVIDRLQDVRSLSTGAADWNSTYFLEFKSAEPSVTTREGSLGWAGLPVQAVYVECGYPQGGGE